jgi:fumarylacetoacetate (FAA) hydrolase
MKLVTYIREGHDQLALLVDGQLYNTDSLHPDLPVSMAMFLNYWEDMYPLALNAEARIKEGMVRSSLAFPLEQADQRRFRWRSQNSRDLCVRLASS